MIMKFTGGLTHKVNKNPFKDEINLMTDVDFVSKAEGPLFKK